jgi:hypothetical protein
VGVDLLRRSYSCWGYLSTRTLFMMLCLGCGRIRRLSVDVDKCGKGDLVRPIYDRSG